jgi:hypothetical protein
VGAWGSEREDRQVDTHLVHRLNPLLVDIAEPLSVVAQVVKRQALVAILRRKGSEGRR